MWIYIYLVYLKLISYFNFNLSHYYQYDYSQKKDVIRIENITLLYYISTILIFKSYFLKIFNINSKFIIVKKDNKLNLLESKYFKSIRPKGIINNIQVNIKNHRYELSNLKSNLYNIDRNIPVIFCLSYYENINKFNDCVVNCNYKKLFKDITLYDYKVKATDKFSDLFN